MQSAKVIFVEITPEPLIPGRTGTAQKTGQPYVIPPKQKAYFHNASHYPIGGEVAVQDALGPYRPGFYLIAGPCLKAGQYGVDFLDREVILVPIADAIKDLASVGVTGK